MLVDKAINEGISEEKFEITTAKKNNIQICGQVEFVDGKPCNLLGTFQDITNEQNLINELPPLM
jgi:hypothetical protein